MVHHTELRSKSLALMLLLYPHIWQALFSPLVQLHICLLPDSKQREEKVWYISWTKLAKQPNYKQWENKSRNFWLQKNRMQNKFQNIHNMIEFKTMFACKLIVIKHGVVNFVILDYRNPLMFLKIQLNLCRLKEQCLSEELKMLPM